MRQAFVIVVGSIGMFLVLLTFTLAGLVLLLQGK